MQFSYNNTVNFIKAYLDDGSRIFLDELPE